MIPILFAPGTSDFASNGLGRLSECTRFEVTEERNGIYEAEFDYPMDGALFSKIYEGCYVYATHDESKTPQAFEIYTHTAPLGGVVTFRAWHISYELNSTIVAPFTASSCSGALAGLKTHSVTENRFTFWTDKSVAASYKVDIPQSARSLLGGSQGSILDVFGKGDFEFDMFNVKLWVNRGTDRGVSIRYGKNLISLEQQLDASNQYNAYLPYWQDSETGEVVFLDHTVLGTVINTQTGALTDHSLSTIQTHTPADILVRYGTMRAVPLDLSSYFDEKPTAAELEARAATLLSNSDNYEVKENLKIDFVQMWQTEEYKNYANLQRVFLCDTVHIYYEKLGINATAKCIKVVYDTLRERYLSMELGTPTTSLSQQISGMVEKQTEKLPTASAMVDAIQKATELITGGYGGYLKYTYLADGTPSEMLVMDSPDESTATNIIRLNKNGLGFSTDGGATYANAWTIDGNLNADYIRTGTLSADRIAANSIGVGKLTGSISNNNWVIDLDAGTLTIGNISASNINTGTLNADLIKAGTISDVAGKNSWNLTTGEFITTFGEVGGWTIDGTMGLTYTENGEHAHIRSAEIAIATTQFNNTFSAFFTPHELRFYGKYPSLGHTDEMPIGAIWGSAETYYSSSDTKLCLNLGVTGSLRSVSIWDTGVVEFRQPVVFSNGVSGNSTFTGNVTINGTGGNVLLMH